MNYVSEMNKLLDKKIEFYKRMNFNLSIIAETKEFKENINILNEGFYLDSLINELNIINDSPDNKLKKLKEKIMNLKSKTILVRLVVNYLENSYGENLIKKFL